MCARIVVVGGDKATRSSATAVFENAGFSEVIALGEIPDAGREVPDLLVLLDDADRCAETRAKPWLTSVPILALVAANDAGAALEAGADDVAIWPPDNAVAHARARRLIEEFQARQRERTLAFLQESMLRIHNLSAHDGDTPEVLRQSLLLAVEAMGFDRASLIAYVDGSDVAYVIASTDDPSLSQFALLIESYPELQAAMSSGKPVLIDDVQNSPVTQSVADKLAETDVRAAAVFPVMSRGTPLGAVMFRHSRTGIEHVDAHRQAFGLMFAEHAGTRLQHGKVIESLSDQTHRISRTRYETERRLRVIDSLKEHFEASADGILVIERDGRIAFINRTAERITGFARGGLVDSDVGLLVPDAQRERVRQAVDQVVYGDNVEAFDLDLRTTNRETVCVSVTTSTVLSESGAAVLSFRDVTAQRVLERELRKTKDFLERLIDSTVDAIVSADLRGNVIIFNQGAERIFGYTAEEVIGCVPVWELYADGVPRQVMRMLRSTQYGGVGRIDQIRREIVNKQGERVPVNMTASMIYEEGREVATVGIFSDLRDRIRIERRLLQAQEKLEMTEKQAILAELAGAAAHELNQPLTSIIGYVELIQVQSAPEAPHNRAVNIIMKEAERMAELVRRIGRITSYETKPYIDNTRIIDIDRAQRQPAMDHNDIVLPAKEPGYVANEFEDEHQITIAKVDLDEVMPGPEEEALAADSDNGGEDSVDRPEPQR